MDAQSDAGNSGALAVRGVADEAVAAFEHELGPSLSAQPALSVLGEVTVTASEVIELGKAGSSNTRHNPSALPFLLPQWRARRPEASEWH